MTIEGAPQQQDMRASLMATRHEESTAFQVWSLPAEPQSSFEIFGSEFSQVVEVVVGPSEVVTAEPGSMLYMSSGMGLGADMGGCGQGCKRCCCAGESMFRLHLENKGNGMEKIALTPKFPAKIVPIDLMHYDGLVFNRGAFLGAIGKNWRVDIRAVQNAGVCCCAGQGLFLNTLHGNGMVFLNAGGSVLTKQLAAGEEMIIDKHGLLCFEKTVTLDIRRAGGCMVCCCAGQGLFNSVLRGPGMVMVHSMSLSKLRAAVGGGAGGGQANQQGGS
jgi:uncharacterized protein (AIM24 family)|eukprot:CAMPEP_0169103174 /NCGR_PEP_ID=MMETSP1015-20121227/22568_1 /TAXON_ID=342587 /ORGANISM="Karlodinium micrum, Strain CCMP2283" /LENGTH=273 /DNA_ID=CAMNT_0009164341 /DNA_START=71 /DNA_END=892 /DNA_ORIENTATION=-